MNAAAQARATWPPAAKHCRHSVPQKPTAKVTRRGVPCRSASASSGSSDKDRKAQELQAKARLLRQQQEEIARQLAELNEESQDLSDQDQKLVQAELSGQEAESSPNQNIPEPIKKLLSSAGVLDAVPWDGPASGAEPPDSYFTSPEGRQDYDWDLDTDSLEDVFEGPEPPPNLQDLVYPDPDFSSADSFSDDEEGFPEDHEHFEPGEGVEAMLKMLEEGGTLPDIEGLIAAEDPKEFQARVQKLVDRYEDSFRKKRDRKLSTEEVREMEKEEAWVPTDQIPVLDEDITEVRPAPAVPDPIQSQYDTLQHCCYLLRRAHLSGKPDEPVKALASAGLVDMKDVQFDDPMICSRGLNPWLKYMEALRLAGAWTQAENVWAEVSDDRPNPEYTVYVDQYVNLPYPQWYCRFLIDNAGAYGARSGTGLIEEIEMPAIMAMHESAPDDPSIPVQRHNAYAQGPPPKKFWFEKIGPMRIHSTKSSDPNPCVGNEAFERFQAKQNSSDPETWGTLSDQEIYRQLAAETHGPETGDDPDLSSSDSASTGAPATATAVRTAGTAPTVAAQGTGRDTAYLRLADRAAAAKARGKARPGDTVNRAGETVTKPESFMLARLRQLQNRAVSGENIQSSMREVVASKHCVGGANYSGTEDGGLLPRVLVTDHLLEEAAKDADKAEQQKQSAADAGETESNVEQGEAASAKQAAQRQSRYGLKSKVMSNSAAGRSAQAADNSTETADVNSPLPSIDLFAQFGNTQQSSAEDTANIAARSQAQAAGSQDIAGSSGRLPNIDLLSQFDDTQQSRAADTVDSQDIATASSVLPNIDLLSQFGGAQQETVQRSPNNIGPRQPQSSARADDDEYGPAFLPGIDLLDQFSNTQEDSGHNSSETSAPTQPQASAKQEDDEYGPAFLPSIDLLGQFSQDQQNAADPSTADEPTLTEPEGSDSQRSAPSDGLLPSVDLLAQFGSTQRNAEDAWTQEPDAEPKASIHSEMNTSSTESKSAGPQTGNTQNEHDQSEYDSELNRFKRMKQKGYASDKFYGEPTINLDGAQVLTSEGWQRVTPASEPGTAWTEGNCMTLSTSLVYELNAVSGKIVRVTCGWSSVNARAWTLQNVVDMYIQCARLGDL